MTGESRLGIVALARGLYEATRAVWERNGFIHVDAIDPLPGWEPDDPAAFYVAALRPTR